MTLPNNRKIFTYTLPQKRHSFTVSNQIVHNDKTLRTTHRHNPFSTSHFTVVSLNNTTVARLSRLETLLDAPKSM